MDSVYQRAYEALMHVQVEQKAQAVFALLEDRREQRLSMEPTRTT